MNTGNRGLVFAVIGLILILAGGLYIGNAYFGWANLLAGTTGQPPASQASAKTGPVVVFNTDKFLGDTLKNSDLKVIQVPVELIPSDAVTTMEDAVGKFLKADAAQGEMAMKRMLADPTVKNRDLGYILSDDHVLFAFPATDVMSSEGIIHRGDIVDIYATIKASVKQPSTLPTSSTVVGTGPTPDQLQAPITKTFTLDTFQKINITALVANEIAQPKAANAAAQAQNENPSVRTYLLALPPQDALVLKYLVDSGAKFDMVLRSPTSTKQFDLTTVTDDYLVELYGLQVLP